MHLPEGRWAGPEPSPLDWIAGRAVILLLVAAATWLLVNGVARVSDGLASVAEYWGISG